MVFAPVELTVWCPVIDDSADQAIQGTHDVRRGAGTVVPGHHTPGCKGQGLHDPAGCCFLGMRLVVAKSCFSREVGNVGYYVKSPNL